MQKTVQGFTFVEVTLVMAILAVLAGATFPFLSNFLVRTNFYFAIDETTGAIRKGQASAMSGKSGETWGVCLYGDNIRLYAGTCDSPTISEDYSIPNNITVTGFSDITFSIRGEPSSTMTVSVEGKNESKEISINGVGGVEVN